MEWKKQSERIEVHTCVIIKTRKKNGRQEYQEVMKCGGDWAELVFILHEDYGQFKNEIEVAKNKHAALDAIAEKLSNLDRPYEFTLPDKTDYWYCAYSKPVIYRTDHEGKLT